MEGDAGEQHRAGSFSNRRHATQTLAVASGPDQPRVTPSPKGYPEDGSAYAAGDGIAFAFPSRPTKRAKLGLLMSSHDAVNV